MCLVGIAVKRHPRFALILAGNRDELHARAAAPAGWWQDHADCFGGRDLVAGGSWLAISRRGRMAVVTNYPGREIAAAGARSRGELVVDFVSGAATPADWLAALAERAAHYAGFCVVVSAAGKTAYLASPDPAGPTAIESQVFTVSNSKLNERWPKERVLADALREPAIDEPGLLDLLQQRKPVPAAPAGGDANPPARAFTPFVTGQTYGTRASTVVTVTHEGRWRIVEQRFGADGGPGGRSAAEFDVSQPGSANQ